MTQKILKAQQFLVQHPVYSSLTNIEDVRVFMKYHIFAVWDFMSLLKSLQKEITCTEVPWKPSAYNPVLVQLINEIVLGEESDVDELGRPMSHFQLYLEAMEEIGADSRPIREFLTDLDVARIEAPLREVVSFHLDVAKQRPVHEVASCFFFGRENLIPEMFQQAVDVLKSSGVPCKKLIYYLQRHIEVDGGEHGPMALKCLNELTDTELKRQQAEDIAIASLEKRQDLWDFIMEKILQGKMEAVSREPQKQGHRLSLS